MKNYNSITIIHEDDSLPLFDDNTSLLSPLPNDKQVNYNPHPQDHLAPPFSASQSGDDSNRPSSLLVGTFNLIATIIGGGVLSLPIAFQKCGIFTTTLFMLTSAYMTYMSLITLCYSSRRCGGSSYGEVVRSAFGERMEEGVSWLLFIFLLFVIAAYMVLIRDIWTPLVGLAMGEEVNGDRMLMGIIVVLLPFLFQRSLHALRWNCYIGFGSILVLCVALCRGGFQRYYYQEHYGDDGQHGDAGDEATTAATTDIEFFKVPTVQDVLFSFPIVMLAFLSHFNILSIQNTLNRPTRQRMKNVTGMAIIASCLLMYLFGLGGYMLYGSKTQGNVLLNIPIAKIPDEDMEEYWLFLLGRIGCGTTLMLAMPLLALPCRDALLEVVDVLFHRSHHRSDSSDASNDTLFWKMLHKLNRNESIDDAAITTEDEVDEIVMDEDITTPERKSPLMSMSPGRNSILIRKDAIQRDWVFRNSMMHYGSTLMIVVCCYIGATKVEGVAEIWSLIGSSLAFLIAFILPFGCFIVIENGVEGSDRHDGWIKAAAAMLVLSIVGAVVCTWNRIASM
eukprot:CAMPEP_0113376668 /NCGR_PEP_ID=MMETSP0013_2-20120614/2750_1 /TAXON_ID=2843 ORGANISM="Skeletonema costatum, Strain 1716" /NCGR_SAMPLE_ID=MMETSP0013_2 /ASSEMBLY_ACC=CAM_ASM_000158 /LENGTH=561 /DNA_ID=CAMNT_0000258761 /DNA_START=89 /DNA_END=1774 /DNA_ORIENTATION=- /assembly_acc=CAM_ASM_000158